MKNNKKYPSFTFFFFVTFTKLRLKLLASIKN